MRPPSLLPLVAATLLGACGTQSAETRERFAATGEIIALGGGAAGAAYACFTCHGLDGAGDGAGAPRLAGMGAGYLNRQMENYAAGLRRHPEMQLIASRLGAEQRQAVSFHYAAMPFAAAVATPPLAGAALYQRGDPARGIARCATCHGTAGEGAGAGNPPLAGQPAPYLAEQLAQWRAGKRRNDPDNVMLEISRQLTLAEARAVSAYAAALPGRP